MTWNPKFFNVLYSWVFAKLVTGDGDWLASNKLFSINGLPLNPTVIAPPSFWRSLINTDVAL